MDEDLLLPPLAVVTQDIRLIRITKEKNRLKNYFELISILKLRVLLQNFKTVVVRTEKFLDVNGKNATILGKATVKLFTLLQNFIPVVADWLGRVHFFAFFHFICPVLQTIIGRKRFLSETSCRARQNCF